MGSWPPNGLIESRGLENREQLAPIIKTTILCSAGFRGRPRGPGPGPPTMFMCLVICATCACHLIIFSEETLFVDAISSVGKTAVFNLNNIWYCDETTITLIVFLKDGQVSESIVVNAKPSHVQHVSLRLYSFLVDFASALLRFAQFAFE